MARWVSFTAVLLLAGVGIFTWLGQTPASMSLIEIDQAHPVSTAKLDSSKNVPSSTSIISAKNAPTPHVRQKPIATSETVIDLAKKGELNLQSTLRQIRQQCPPQWQADFCNQMSREFVLRIVPEDQQAQILSLFDEYIAYENYLKTSSPLEQLGLAEQFEKQKQLRDAFFSEANRELLFGREEARMAYEIAKRRLLSQVEEVPNPEAILAKLDQLAQSKMGKYYQDYHQHAGAARLLDEQINTLQSLLVRIESDASKQKIQQAISALEAKRRSSPNH